MISNTQKEIDKLIEFYFNQPKVLYEHLFASYHQFVSEIIPYYLIQEQNYFYENVDKEFIYLHGFKCSNIRIKPSTFENDNEIKFPSDARKNHLNYFATIVADVQQFIEKIDSKTGEKVIKHIGDLEKETSVANIPIMVKSKYCSTNIKQELKTECKFDPGGYFIVNGAEKIVLSMEKMVDNKDLVFTKKDSSYETGLIYTSQINSRKHDWSDNLQILTIKNRKDGVLIISNSSQLVDIPLFILMRALGVEADQNIISYITYDLEDTKMLNMVRSSVTNSTDENGNPIRTKEEAIEYLITKLKKNKRISQSDESLARIQKKMYLEKILRQDLLPHLGEDNTKKIVFLGLMANKLINVMLGRQDVDDRDALHNKRIEPPGVLLGQLFRQNWKKMLNEIGKHFKKKNQSDDSPINVISQIKPSIIEQGLKTALATGIWGMNKTKKGVAQSLQRLSWIQGISYLRRILAPSMDESTTKLTSIRHVNNNQAQLLCCLTGDSEVLMADKTLKQIKDINNDDYVMTINPQTLKMSPSSIYNKFELLPTKLFKIQTENNNIIKATDDHPFLVFENETKIWKKVEELKIGSQVYIVINNQCVKSKIVLIEEIPNEIVYDFTTQSDNHSFIANSFVVSNCVETPEGSKIGIVKSLAMMSTITVQNSTQTDVLKSILKQNKFIKHPYDIDPLEMNSWIKIMINGDWFGVCKISHAQDIYNNLKNKRRENIIDRYTSIIFNYSNKEIRCYSDGGRLIRPLLIVTNNKLNISPEVIKDINEEIKLTDKTKSWKKILSKYPNLIEYEDIESLNYLLVAEGEHRLTEALEAIERKVEYIDTTKINRYGDYRFVKYTHSDFHSWVMMGTVVANIPFSNHNYANRNIIHFSQAKQSIGVYLSSYKDRMDISQVLYHPQIPLVTTQAMKYNGCLDLPYGENAIVAVASYSGFNQEDSIIFNQSAIDRGLFRADTLKKYHSEVQKNPSTSQDDIFTKPDRNKVTGMKQGNYDKLNDKGYAPEETIIDNEDIIIGKISPIQPTGNNNKVYKDNSEIFKSNVQGVIDRVHTGIYNLEGYEMYNVRVRMERKPIMGDKFTCYDDSHQVLTSQGWINIKDITLNHKVASLVNNKLAYQNPSQVQSYDYEGNMYLVESNQISLCVTPNHRMWVRKRHSNPAKVRDYSDELAENILHERRYYKKNVDGLIVERSDKYFDYGTDGQITHFKINEQKLDINSWLMFFGIWLAEGYVDKYSHYVRVCVHKKRVKKELDDIITNLELTYHSTKDHPDATCNNIYTISSKPIGAYMEQFSVGAVNKTFPEWVWNLTPDLCKLLLDGMMLGDGHTMTNGSRRYDTSSLKLADGFQRLCLHAGYSTNIAVKYEAGHCSQPIKTGKNIGKIITMRCNAYRMTIIETQVEPIVNKNIKKNSDGTITGNCDSMVPFKGKVYCCTVPGQGVIVVRRNGLMCLSGNSRHGQKGTIGITYPQRDMPFTESGIVPDLILNPHGYPSRMSLGHFIECLASKEAAESGHFVDGTPFNNYDVKQLPEALKKLGYSPYGTEKMYCGFTGRKMDVEIFIGPVYTIRLKHMVLDKVHGRARGPKQALTRQPLEGRSRDGGLKIGEMEKDAMVAHGMSQFLKERMMETSDISKAYVCDECGMFASKVIDKDYYRCKGCHNSTRISAVVIPHAAKLLFQELTSVNILPRIRTERSIYGDES
jgi:DNA-directed RNA polymerase beta subunit